MKSNSDTRKPYTGPVRSLVLAIDVGTTFSGVSYAILEPGEVPKIHGVTRFPGQEHVAGNCKIPSILWYDARGKMMAAGAEAETSTILSQAEDEGWIKAELFKLRLRPRTMQLNMNGMRLGHLPPGRTAVDVFGDFLAYLFLCTRNFITDTHANGSMLWATVEHDIKFVLSHPNGWEGAQQSKLRRSAIHGGLIPNTSAGKARIFFVTEGEASLHACVLNGLAADVLSDPSKPGFLIADAGGGTWDISAYSITGQNPLLIEEIAPPDCIFAGSVFVSRRARKFLEEKLKSSKYGSPEAVEHITRRFDETTKRLFRDDRSLQFISFGSPLDKDPTVGIRGGQLKLTGAEVRELFEPSVEAAFDAIKAQIDASAGVIKSVWLVGGFAANHWLFSQLQEKLRPYGVAIHRPDSQTSKAVCDGAVGFYVDHHVSVRMSKAFYGVEFLRTFDPEDGEHVARESTLVELPSGPRLLPDAFDCILKRGLKVKESTIFSRKYSTELTNLDILSVFEVLLWCYRGKGEIPTWIYRDAEEFSTLCVVRADLSPLKSSASPQTHNDKTFWKIIFSIEIHFGLTEFRARIKWIDNGEIKYGPASIVYNERGRRAEEDEPDMYPEDDVTIMSSRSDQIRSSTPLSRPRSFAPGPGPAESVSTRNNEIPEVARLPDELQEPRGGSKSRSSSDREPSRGRKSGKGKGKGKEKEILPDESTDSHTSSRLADTLASVWGNEPPPSASPSQGGDAAEPLSQSAGAARPASEEAHEQKTEPEAAAFEVAATSGILDAEGVQAPRVPTAPRTPAVEALPELEAKTPPATSNSEPTATQTEAPPAPQTEATVAPQPDVSPAPQSDVSPAPQSDVSPAPQADTTPAAQTETSAPPGPQPDATAAPQTDVLQTERPDSRNSAVSYNPTETEDPPAANDTAVTDVAKGGSASPPAAEPVQEVNPESMPLPSSAAECASKEVDPEQAPPVDSGAEGTKSESTPEGEGKPRTDKSPYVSRKPTPFGSPAVVVKALADVTAADLTPGLGLGAHLSPSPHHLPPELIPLPLSATNSPKTALSPKPQGSPLGLLDNTVLPAERARRTPKGSRAASTAVSPSLHAIDVDASTEDVSAHTRSTAATPKRRSRKASKNASPAVKVSAQHSPTKKEEEGGEMEGLDLWKSLD